MALGQCRGEALAGCTPLDDRQDSSGGIGSVTRSSQLSSDAIELAVELLLLLLVCQVLAALASSEADSPRHAAGAALPDGDAARLEARLSVLLWSATGPISAGGAASACTASAVRPGDAGLWTPSWAA